MEPKRRLSEQQQQEYRSRDQLAGRFDDYGWVPDPISRDLGEDFIVRVYDAGVSTGLAFFVQLKSTDDLAQFEIEGGYISYQLRVKDLIHWDSSASPVLLIIWDVNRLTGCWISVHDAIAELDKRKPAWHDQKTVRVRIPRFNTTDDEGLRRIRQYIANYYYPLVAKGRSVKIDVTFVFPDTPNGRASRKALERCFSAGDTAEIDGEFIEELQFSEWWTRLFGEVDPSSGSLTIGAQPSEHSVPLRIDLVSPDGEEATLPYVDFRTVKQGSEEFTVTNEHQLVPLQFCIVFRRSHFTASIKIQHLGKNVQETREILHFMKAWAKGGKLRMTYHKTGEVVEGLLPVDAIDPPNPEFVDLVDALCLIQRKTGWALALSPDGVISQQDAIRARKLVAVLENGRMAYGGATVTGRFQVEALESMLRDLRAVGHVEFKIASEDSQVQICGTAIPLGPVVRYCKGEMEISATELESAISEMQTGDMREVKLVNADVIEEYHRWLPKEEKA